RVPGEKERLVDQLLESLGLERAANTAIGEPDAAKKGVSGGERKRCALAMELLIRPGVLFLDEPTTGLDAATALKVVKLLRRLARTGRTVIMTIPSSEAYLCFDDYILMSDGQILYQGEAGRSAVDYFARHGFKCPRYSSPPDYFFMYILHQRRRRQAWEVSAGGSMTDDVDAAEQRDSDQVRKLLRAWATSPEARAIAAEVQSPRRRGGIQATAMKYQSSTWTQFGFLYGRASKNAFRNPMVLARCVVMALFQILLMGLTFLRTDQKVGQAAVQNRLGVLFFLSAAKVMTGLTSTIPIFLRERNVFLREEST
ncbi:ATP-binding cassette sub- G member 2, partial [Cladochytrium tenue]